MKLKMIIPLFLAIVIFVFSVVFYLQNQQNSSEKLISNDQFKIEIDIPNTDYDILNEELNNYVNYQQTKFFSQIDITQELKTTLEITHNQSIENNMQIITLYSKINVGNIYKYDICTIHYDINNNKIMLLNDYILDNNSLQILSDISYHALYQKLNSDNVMINDQDIRTITSPELNNYDSFIFTNDGLKLTFILEQEQGLEIEILLPYSQINYLLKNEYRRNVTDPYKRDLSQFVGKKLISFTFDDGPNYATTKILLDGLNKYNAKVTFFVVGNRTNANSEILKRAYVEGNQIGSHTYNHKNLIKLNARQIIGEINNTNSVVREIIGAEPSVFRPPYGNINSFVKNYINVPIIMWNIDSLDWKYRDKEVVKNNIITKAEDGDIVLLHDLYESSVEGALLAMEELYNQGFAFVTVSEMLELKGLNWEYGKNYYKF